MNLRETKVWVGVCVEDDGETIKCLTPVLIDETTGEFHSSHGDRTGLVGDIDGFKCVIPTAITGFGPAGICEWVRNYYGVKLRPPAESGLVIAAPTPGQAH